MRSSRVELTPIESKALVNLCRAGKLYDVEGWIEAEKSIRPAPEIRKTPLTVALDLGFHSLVELLIRYEDRPEIKNRALAFAVEAKRLDLIELLVANGAQVESVPLADVLAIWEPSIIDFFLRNGADVVAGAPFAVAFSQKVRTALRPFREYKQTHPELADELQEQADMALRFFASDGNLKWISLMLWIGSDARARGPSLDERYDDDPESYTTAVEAACFNGNIDVLKALKLNPSRDELTEMLSCASILGSKDTISYLLRAGANPNDKENGGSSALDRQLDRLGLQYFRAFISKQLVPKYSVRDTLEALEELAANGALWKPMDKAALSSARRSLYKCEPGVTVDIVRLFARYDACSSATPMSLLGTPRMKQHLASAGIYFRVESKTGRIVFSRVQR